MPYGMLSETPQPIARHKAAIERSRLSRPVQLALAYGLLTPQQSFFDYGCGRGGDGRRLRANGYQAAEWDPYYCPTNPRIEAEVVNLGYVINTIEDQTERREALLGAWRLTRCCLLIAAQVSLDYAGEQVVTFGDGIVTSRNTFQKVFSQSELKSYIETHLEVSAYPLSIGIFVAFKDKTVEQEFRFRRYQPRHVHLAVEVPTDLYHRHQQVLDPLLNFFVARGRWPLPEEAECFAKVIAAIGSLRKAQRILQQVIGQEPFREAVHAKRENLLVYLCGETLSGRPKFSDLPPLVQVDIREHFRSYKHACHVTDQLLSTLAQPDVLKHACRRATLGKRVANTHYIHYREITKLPLELRVLETLASRFIGVVDGATLVRFHADKPLVAYLFYPYFDQDPHPRLALSIRTALDTQEIQVTSYIDHANPPVLHRKETFVDRDYPPREKFARLSAQEEAWGLLDYPADIGLLKGWQKRLDAAGVILRGHRVIRQSNDKAASCRTR
jgi:DNA phosphorothioation-associated putative methyltransferase